MTGNKHASRAGIDAFYGDRLAAPAAAGETPLLAPDYDPAALAALPDGLVATSFGCGDPLAFAAVETGATVLDLGCGAGMDLLLAAERVGPAGRVIGLDSNPDMVRRARENAARAGAGQVEVMEGLIEALPLPDESVDWIISNCVINLSMDKPAAFAEIARVLKPGGRILVSDLVAETLPDWIAAHRDLYAACIAGAVAERDYLALAEAAGLDDVHVLDRMTYGATEVRALVAGELPVAIDSLAARLGVTRDDMLDRIAAEMSGKVRSIKLHARRGGGEAATVA
ncbi:methyltransferase domain-containing protein [Rhodovulum sp. YNF3179]|uniref:methyltransferase domain-containing protein n=1 Tax=Rhodovulum sp. YNF3179 TaxID=3425127 RepID=UPI003D328C41